jgi:N-acetylmuramoyl-L-alanine amidase
MVVKSFVGGNMNNMGTNRSRRHYRLNGKKLAGTILMLAFIAAVAVVVAWALKDAGDVEVAVAGTSLPDAGNSPAVTLETAQGVKATATAIKTAEPQLTGSSGSLDGRTVVVDAGHGGFDPGAIGVSGAEEDNINLAVAQELKAVLQEMGSQVIMTRDDENALAKSKEEDMAERRRIIEESGSDIVVSIHMNNFKEDPDVSGPLVLFMPGSEKGQALAKTIQSSLNTALDTDGSARSEDLYVLKSGNQPCVLVECGYLSNEEEEHALTQPEYQKKIAQAICDGVVDFLED